MATVSNSKKPTEAQRPQATTFARLRLIAIACVLAGWLGWLGYLVAVSSHPVVLSEPQFLMSTLDVLADVQADADGRPASRVIVQQVHWPRTRASTAVGTELTVVNLPDATRVTGWKGPGEYILPLVKEGDNYRVAAIPFSAGYHPTDGIAELPHIYPVSPETLRQLDQMPKPEPARKSQPHERTP